MATPHSSTPLPPNLQEEEGKELQNFISSLPKEYGFIDHLYRHQGFWRSAKLMGEILNCQKHFQPQQTDIILVTAPKSGTTWLSALLYATINRNKYPNLQNHPLLSNNPHTLVPYLEHAHGGLVSDESRDFAELGSISSQRLFVTHSPYVSLPESVKSSTCKMVFLCRSAKDNLVSLWHFANKIGLKDGKRLSLEDAFDQFCRGISPCGPFWDHILRYWLESLERPEKILFLKYEEVKDKPMENLKKLAEFIECPFSIEEEANGLLDEILTLCSLDNLRNLEVNRNGEMWFGVKNEAFFRRGEVGDSVNFLTPEMIEKLDSITEEKLGSHGLKL